MKRLIFMTLIIFILSGFVGTFVYADIDTDGTVYYIDIGLFYGNSAKSSVTIKNNEGTFTVNASDV